jgi:hypothetical protein
MQEDQGPDISMDQAGFSAIPDQDEDSNEDTEEDEY